MSQPFPNSDESLVTTAYPFIGNFHKTLPHNEYGEVDPDAHRKFERTCLAIEAGMPINFEEVPKGPLHHPEQSPFDPQASAALTGNVARFTSPLAGAATEAHGPDPKTLEMSPAPGCRSITAAAEMAELYWMALLRDAPLVAFQNDRTSPDASCADISAHDAQLDYSVTGRIDEACKWVKILFNCAVSHDPDAGKLALKVVWRQKWLVHRRARPEVYGGLVQMQCKGYKGCTRDYGLPTTVAACPNFNEAFEATLAAVAKHNKAMNDGAETFFLPMAFSAGSPPHPAYGAGHATVAGACVTTLKAWFDEDAKLADVFAVANHATSDSMVAPKDPPGGKLKLLQPGYRSAGSDLEAFCAPMEYSGADAELMTIGGELNKIASNVAMGRSMGGVHWRTDNTRSLRLGEAIAIEILRKRTLEYAERPVSFTFRAFDGHIVRITGGQVQLG